MRDHESRALDRTTEHVDPAQVINERVRRGEISQGALRLLAYLRHPGASELVGCPLGCRNGLLSPPLTGSRAGDPRYAGSCPACDTHAELRGLPIAVNLELRAFEWAEGFKVLTKELPWTWGWPGSWAAAAAIASHQSWLTLEVSPLHTVLFGAAVQNPAPGRWAEVLKRVSSHLTPILLSTDRPAPVKICTRCMVPGPGCDCWFSTR